MIVCYWILINFPAIYFALFYLFFFYQKKETKKIEYDGYMISILNYVCFKGRTRPCPIAKCCLRYIWNHRLCLRERRKYGWEIFSLASEGKFQILYLVWIFFGCANPSFLTFSCWSTIFVWASVDFCSSEQLQNKTPR